LLCLFDFVLIDHMRQVRQVLLAEHDKTERSGVRT
jgi:hypothetical protein